MTSAITRTHAGAAHAHGFAKALKGDAPAEGFEALFAAVAVAVTHPLPALSPVAADAAAKRSDEGKAGEGRAEHDLFAGCPISAILAGRFKSLPEKADRAQRKMVGQRILADKNALLRNAGHRIAADRREGLQGVGQRIRSRNRLRRRFDRSRTACRSSVRPMRPALARFSLRRLFRPPQSRQNLERWSQP